MASIGRICRSTSATILKYNNKQGQIFQRCLSTTPIILQEEKKKGFFSNFLQVRTIDPGKESHSRQLSDKDVVYELQIHAVKPEFMDQYLREYTSYVEMVSEKKLGAELAGSWTVEIGDQDEAVHLWKYPGGYPMLNEARYIYRTDSIKDEDFLAFRKNRNQMLRSRMNQILLAFSFWGEMKPRSDNHIYELRSYVLKPGTMIEWGNNWAKGIKSRTGSDEAVAGFFSHIGDLNQAHHIWAYKDLQSRKEVREAAWRKPGWDECVAYTVPLIRHMKSRILVPTPFSPLK